jgi:hypothetical protein
MRKKFNIIKVRLIFFETQKVNDKSNHFLIKYCRKIDKTTIFHQKNNFELRYSKIYNFLFEKLLYCI